MIDHEIGRNGSQLNKFRMDKDGTLMLKEMYSNGKVSNSFAASDCANLISFKFWFFRSIL